jgi:DNA-directed RNA polymerase subunit RPC12/RpoP
MDETYVRLLCPDCSHGWESTPTSLPAHDERIDCPDCSERRRLAEFARTGHDLRAVKSLG